LYVDKIVYTESVI